MKRQIPKKSGFDVQKPTHFKTAEITVSIPEISSESPGKLLKNSLLNLLMHRFIAKLQERNIAEKTVLKDLEFIIEDYLINCNYGFDMYDEFEDDLDY